MATAPSDKDRWYNWCNKLTSQWLIETNIRHGIYSEFARGTTKLNEAKTFTWILANLRLVPNVHYRY